MLRRSQILIDQMSYVLPNARVIFKELTLSFPKGKTALVGQNGIGKSTLLKLITGELIPNSGTILLDGDMVYVPQNPRLSSALTLASFLGVDEKLQALARISQGSVDEHDFDLLNEDWGMVDRLQQQLSDYGLEKIPFQRPISRLSGGEITRLWLTKAFHADVDVILLDEPTNHLDITAKNQLFVTIEQWDRDLIVVSHDRELLNLMDHIIELNTLGARCYGGNFSCYQQQKNLELTASQHTLQEAKKSLKKTSKTIQASKEKHAQRQAKGVALRRSGSQAKMILDAMKNRSTQSLGALSIRHQRMLEQATEQLDVAKSHVEHVASIQVKLPKSKVPQGKMILNLENVSFIYPGQHTPLIQNLNLTLQGPAKIALTGDNGSGKTTLIKLILRQLAPTAGTIAIGTEYINYLDQDLSQLAPDLTLLNHFMRLNPQASENEAYQGLASFLFKNSDAHKWVRDLSGGERIRAMLASVLLSSRPPQLLILDEPTNHLDLTSIHAVVSALENYQGALIVISHDMHFLNDMGMDRVYLLKNNLLYVK